MSSTDQESNPCSVVNNHQDGTPRVRQRVLAGEVCACGLQHFPRPSSTFPFSISAVAGKVKICDSHQSTLDWEKKRFCSVKHCDAPLRERCIILALLDPSVPQVSSWKKNRKNSPPNLHLLELRCSANNHQRVCLCGAILVQLW